MDMKNLSQYSLIKAWLIIALVALTYNKLKRLNIWNYSLSLIADSSIGFKSSSSSFKKFLPLKSDV